MNWMPERQAVSVQNQGDKVTDKNIRCSLVRTPGSLFFYQLPTNPIRGLFPGERRMFAAAGNRFYEVLPTPGHIDRSSPGFTGASGEGPAGGTIGNDGRPVQCFFNGNQALIVSAGQAYCDNGNGPVACQFSDPLFDLVIDPADTSGTTLTNSKNSGLFDASDIGRTVEITGGGGFNVGLSQTIISVNSNGGGVGASAWGIAGSTLGTGIEWLGQMTFFDLQLLSPTIVYSAGHKFGPSDVGLTLHISSGTGWTPGDYQITGLVLGSDLLPNGDAILDRAAGTTGATAGVGDMPGMMVTASQGSFLDGYFFVVPDKRATPTDGPSPTKLVYYSEIDDGKMWNPLHFFEKANYPDNIAALYSDHQELYTLGTLESTQVWRDIGTVGNPFQPDPGAAMHVGCMAPFSVSRLRRGIAWIGQDVRRGSRQAYHAEGYNPVVVSTPAVEAAWAGYTTVDDAVAYTEQDRGHECWVINFPTANATWVYDATTGWWHQRGFWNGTSWDRIKCWVHCVAALTEDQKEVHYGGDYGSGNIYILSSAYRTDNGSTIKRRRRAPHLTLENTRRFYARFEIDCDVATTERIFWNRLGNGRDRIWQLDTSQSAETGPTTLTLAWSDDRARTFNTVFSQSTTCSDVTLTNAYIRDTDATWH